MAQSNPPPSPPGSGAVPWGYVPAIGPKLKVLLAFLFAFVALLGATGAYLSAISFLNWYRSPANYTSPFTFWMFLGHVGVGVASLIPFFIFGTFHFLTARNRPNRVAVRLGLLMFGTGILTAVSGVALIQLEGMPQLPTGTVTRTIVYAAHIVLPLVAVWLYVLHRRAGPDINWRWGVTWLTATAGFVGMTVIFHGMDPRSWNAEGPKEGAQYFHPSDARTADGKFINAEVMMADEYCMKCHQDIYNDHLHSAHKFSSFNNPAYLFSIKETREVALKRDGNVKASRWCAGCHDPVPFFSGAFDDPNFDLDKHPTAHAGITCTTCHAITHVNATIGNAAYTIEEPQHYPFAFSKNPTLQWLNNQLVKAKPDFHKKTFLKPFHKTEEFCSTCHKVGLPVALNHYKDFLRGQNHYDSFLLSGVSGHGARAFYDPPQAKENCAACHMGLKPSNDFGSKDFDGTGVRKRHDHFFPAANTGLFELVKRTERYKGQADKLDQSTQKNIDFLKGTAEDGSDKKLRIDIFALKAGAADSDQLLGPIRPQLPKLTPGRSYTVEVVVRTLNVGHHFSQGTVDSNEIWVDFSAKTGDRVIGRNGAIQKPGTTQQTADLSGEVDPWAHFINVWALDRNGLRIDRRNPQDIFAPLYDHQIPPGAANVVHYRLDVPADAKDPIELKAILKYRKFDYKYMEHVHRGTGTAVPTLPVVEICADTVILGVDGGADPQPQESPIKPAWQRWNDYGIACYIEAGVGAKRGQTRQAEAAFRVLQKLEVKDAHWHGHLNLARILIDEGKLSEAAEQIEKAKACDPPAPWWKAAWFGALVNSETGKDLDSAIADLAKIVDPANRDEKAKRDFTRDYVVWNKLSELYFRRAVGEEGDRRTAGLLEAIKSAEQVLDLDAEDFEAHDRLQKCHQMLGKRNPAPPTLPETFGANELVAWAESAVNGRAAKSQRIEDSAKVAVGTAKFVAIAGDVYPPRLPTLRTLVTLLRKGFHAETDAEVRASLSAALAEVHLASERIFKADELARSNAANRFRERPGNEAANYAGRDRVIYPTTEAHRESIRKTGDLPRN